MTSRKTPTTYLLKNSFARQAHAGPGLEFARAYYFEHCNAAEQDVIDSLVLAMVDNMHKKSDAPFSPADALEVIGSIIMFIERAPGLGGSLPSARRTSSTRVGRHAYIN